MTSGQGLSLPPPEGCEQAMALPFRKPIPEPQVKDQNLNLAVFSGPLWRGSRTPNR